VTDRQTDRATRLVTIDRTLRCGLKMVVVVAAAAIIQ